MQENELVHDLILESKEHLRRIEPDLLELERKGKNVPNHLINGIFRAIHSIKGGFGFFGYKQITTLAHAMENVLSKLRDKNLDITQQVVDALLIGIDKLQVILDDFDNSNNIPIQQELDLFAPFISDEIKYTDKDSIQTADLKKDILTLHSSVKKELIDESISNGRSIYHIILHSKKDLIDKQLTPSALFERWEKLGKIIDFMLDLDSVTGLQGSTDVDMTYSILFGSVLEPDLIIIGLHILPEQLKMVDCNELKSQISGNNTNSQKIAETVPAVNSNSIEAPVTDDTIRVKVQVLNSLMNLAGELVLSRNQLMQHCSKKLIDSIDSEAISNEVDNTISGAVKNIRDCSLNNKEILENTINNEFDKIKSIFSKHLEISLKELQGTNTTLQSIDTVTSQLQENIMQTRLQPVSVVFSKFPRVIRDLSKKLGKDMDLIISGQNVELDKSIIELLSDPLTHLVRNSADHGIESPEERKRAGKNKTGIINLRAYHAGGKVIVEIEDDGHGLDLKRIANTAIKKNLINEQMTSTMSDREIQLLIMQAGFSTAESVSDISGRGVGMDVVKSNIERLGGSIDLESEFGVGTKISLTLPLTLAIIPSLIVSTENVVFAIPQMSVEELVRIRSFEVTTKIECIQGSEVMRLRGKLLPLVRLSSILQLVPTFLHPESGARLPDKRNRWSDRRNGTDVVQDKNTLPSDDRSNSNRRQNNSDRRNNVSNAVKIVVLKAGQHHYGLVVDSVYDSEEIVVKPLSDYFKSIQCYAGATILGDGKVAMILDPGGIAQRANLKFIETDKQKVTEQQNLSTDDSSKIKEILLFDNGSNERFGLDLKAVARIEKVEAKEIELVGDCEYIKRDGSSFPLIRLHDILSVSTPPVPPEEFFIILPKKADRRFGIVAASVFDVVETKLVFDKNSIRGIGIMGSTVIDNRLTIIIDMNTLLSTVELQLGN
jgi:two-component system chemotaxis sensor kinase CheA